MACVCVCTCVVRDGGGRPPLAWSRFGAEEGESAPRPLSRSLFTISFGGSVCVCARLCAQTRTHAHTHTRARARRARGRAGQASSQGARASVCVCVLSHTRESAAAVRWQRQQVDLASSSSRPTSSALGAPRPPAPHTCPRTWCPSERAGCESGLSAHASTARLFFLPDAPGL